MTDRIARVGLIVCTALLFIVLALPFARTLIDPAFGGSLPIRLQDDGAYFSRIQAAALGRFGTFENGITAADLGIRAAGPGLLEKAEGLLLGWTGLSGVSIGTLFMVLLAPLFLPLVYLLLRSLGTRNDLSLIGAVVCSAVLLGPLSRPHLALLLPLMVGTLVLVQRIAVRPFWWLVPVAAVFLALLPSLYFWVWTFVWGSCGVLFLLRWIGPSDARKKKALLMLGVTAGAALLLSLPGLISTWFLQSTDPAFEEMAFYRSGLYPTHAIESPRRSGLLLLSLLGAVALYVRLPQQRSTLRLPLALVAGVFVVNHLHVVTGTDFLAQSHYEPMVVLSVLVLGVWIVTAVLAGLRTREHLLVSGIALLAAFILLVGSAYDYRLGWQFIVRAPDTSMLHLKPALESLRDGTRATVFTDRDTAVEVVSRTDDDTVFTPYVQHLLVSNDEFAARGCATALFQPGGADVEELAWHTLQFRGEFMLPERTEQFKTVCDALREDAGAALQRFGVDLVLWNEKAHPDWVMDSVLLERLERGEGWSLWKVR